MTVVNPGAEDQSMSLLSQLVPFSASSLHIITVAGSAADTVPQKPELGRFRSSIGRGRPIGDAMALTRWLLCNEGDDSSLARLGAAVDEHVDVWTPVLHTTSRFALVSTLARLDDAIADVTVTFTDAVEEGSTVALIWQATGRFLRPACLDDNHLIEPSGLPIRVAGTTWVSFTTAPLAGRIRCDYDRLSVLEQLMAGVDGEST